MSHVHTDSEGGTATGMVLGAVLVLVVIVLAAFLFFGGVFRPATAPAQSTQPSGGTNIQVNPPSNPGPNIQVNPPAQQAPSGQQAPSQSAPSKP